MSRADVPQSDALPPPYPKAYVPAPAVPPYPKPYVSAPTPPPAPIASPSAPARSSSPTDALDAEPPTMPAAPSWSSEARPAAAVQDVPLSGAPPSLDPRTGPAYDPFAPQPAPGAPTAAYAAVSAGERARPGRPLVWLLGVAVFVIVAAFGLSALFASHRPLTPARVVSVPAEAHVRVDGVEVPGLTPLVLPAPLDPTRSHEIEVTRAGFRAYVIVVRVGDTQPQQIAILTPE